MLHMANSRRNNTGYKYVTYQPYRGTYAAAFSGRSLPSRTGFKTAVEAAVAVARALQAEKEAQRDTPPRSSLRSTKGSAAQRFSPPQAQLMCHLEDVQARSDLKLATKASLRTIALDRCRSIKRHMIQLLTTPSRAMPMSKDEAEIFVHQLSGRGFRRYRDDWAELFMMQRAIPCGGSWDGGSVGCGCPSKITYNFQEAMQEQREQGSVGQYTERWQMDHSLQPLKRTMDYWQSCPKADLQEDLLLHLLYAVKPATIGGVHMHAALIPRCQSCHATWAECHGENWQVRRMLESVPHISGPLDGYSEEDLQKQQALLRCL